MAALDRYIGRSAFITGGASGIGLGIAEALAERGMAVALADIDGERAVAQAERLRRAGHRAWGLTLDVRNEQAWIAALDEAESEVGPPSIVCANAGVTGSVLPIADSSLEGWRFTLDVNLDGCFLAARTAIPRLLLQGLPGYFVATSSGGAFVPHATNGAYSAAKAGVNAMCEALADELKHTDVRVSVLCPGLVKTRLHETSRQVSPAATKLGGHPESIVKAFETAIAPREVGEIVVRGIEREVFWLFTTEQMSALLEQRQQRILQDFREIFPEPSLT